MTCSHCDSGVELRREYVVFNYKYQPFCSVECWRDNIDGKPAKPKEKKYRPWKRDEVPVGEVVCNKDNSGRAMITGAYDLSMSIDGTIMNYERVLLICKRADGSPCGAEE